MIYSIMIIIFLLFINLALAQITLNGTIFNGTTLGQYAHQILSCNDNHDCSIICAGIRSCENTTILCPINGGCNVSCSGDFLGCTYTDIHWIQGNTNTLSCEPNNCVQVKYPPSISDTTPFIINCTDRYKCQDHIIQCPDNAKCQIICNEKDSCEDSIIYCPSTSICDIQCIGPDSCYETMVYWSYNPLATSILTCPDEGDQCNFIQLPTTIEPPLLFNEYNLICDQDKECASSQINCPSNGTCIISCTGEASCAGSIINCPSHSDCNIECIDYYSCLGSTINGPNNYALSISCYEPDSCYRLTIHAEKSNYFHLNISAFWNGAAYSTKILFPPRDPLTYEARAEIYVAVTNDLIGYKLYQPPQFYAINGWNDINITYTEADWEDNDVGIMYCGYNYSLSCRFDNDSFSCNPENTICDNYSVPITTINPTNNPLTTSPSEVPSVPPTTPSKTPSESPSATTTATCSDTDPCSTSPPNISLNPSKYYRLFVYHIIFFFIFCV